MPLELTEDEREEMARRNRRSACLQQVFSGPDGIKALEYLDQWAGFKNDTFDPDPYVHARKAGIRAMSVFIHNVLDNDVDKIKKILKEKQDG